MMHRNIKISLRRLKADRINSLIKLSGLVLGLSIASIVLIFAVNELSFDKFHANKDCIYRLVNTNEASDMTWATAPFIAGSSLKNNFPEVQDFAHQYIIHDFEVKKGNSKIPESKILCTESSFFNIFSFKFLYGNASDFDIQKNSIILTKSACEKYFGSQNPIGEPFNIVVKNTEYSLNVCGVINDFPANSSIEANYIANIDLSFDHLQKNIITTSNQIPSTDDLKNNWNNGMFFNNYLLLSKNVNANDFTKKLEAYTASQISNNEFSKYSLQPLSEMYFNSCNYVNTNTESGNKQIIILFCLIGLIILTTACINYFNISVAQLFSKRRSIAINNICGAQRKNTITQLVTESIIIWLLTLPLALITTHLLLPTISNILEKSYELNLINNWLGLTLIFITTLAAGAISGFLVSLKAVSQKTIDALNNAIKQKQKLTPSKVMLLFQIVTLMVLSMSVMVIYKQIHYSINKDLGFNKENLLVIDFNDTEATPGYSVFKNTIQSNPNILSVSGAMWIPPTQNTMDITLPKKNEPETIVSVRGLFVDYGFEKTMGIEVLKGKGFDKINNTFGVLVNQSAVKEIGLDDVIGEHVAFGEVKGVVKDFHYGSMHSKIPPTLIVVNPGMVRYMVLRMASGKSLDVIHSIQQTWEKLNPSAPIKYEFFDQKIQKLYSADIKMAKIITSFALLAVAIALLGLIGLSLFACKQRIKEIGIRKVNGAKVLELIQLLNRDFVIWIITAFFIAWPIAYFAMKIWLQTFAYKTQLGWWLFLIAGFITMATTILTVSLQTFKAARKNPAEALRYE